MEYEPPRIGTLTDKESVLAAVTQCGLVLRYADDDLRLDKEIVPSTCPHEGQAGKPTFGKQVQDVVSTD